MQIRTRIGTTKNNQQKKEDPDQKSKYEFKEENAEVFGLEWPTMQMRDGH